MKGFDPLQMLTTEYMIQISQISRYDMMNLMI